MSRSYPGAVGRDPCASILFQLVDVMWGGMERRRNLRRALLGNTRMYNDVEGWPTNAQMVAIWHGREVVNGMVGWARAQTDEIRARSHPKIPHVEEARQYNVQVEDKFTKTMEDVVQHGMKMGFNAEGSAGEDIVRSTLARSASIFGGNGPTAGAKSAVPPGKRALSPPGGADESDDDLPAEKKRRDRLKDFKKHEAERAKKAEDRERPKEEKSAARKLEAQQAKEDRQAQAKTCRPGQSLAQRHARTYFDLRNRDATLQSDRQSFARSPLERIRRHVAREDHCIQEGAWHHRAGAQW